MTPSPASRVWIAPWRTALASALMWGMLGALACAAPWAWVPQEAADLAGYFAWQGSRPGPADIVVVTIDATSARNILLPEDPRRYHRCEALRFGAAVPGYRSAPPPRQLARWPRCLFSRALYALARGGARLVALDIQFSPRMAAGQDLAVSVFEAQDQELGAALASVGRSLIGQGVESSPGVLNPGPDGSEPIRERLAPLTPTVAAGSLGAAPFLIQRDLLGRTSQFEVFMEGGLPGITLPALAVQADLLANYPALLRVLRAVAPARADLLPETLAQLLHQGQLQATSLLIRQVLHADAGAPRRALQIIDTSLVSPAERAQADRLRLLVKLYTAPPRRHFAHFGPARTIRTVGVDRLLGAPGALDGSDHLDVRGKAVFMGVDYGESESAENNRTVLSGTGIGVTGVELLATAFATLRDDSAPRPPSQAVRALVAGAFGLILTALLGVLPVRLGTAAGVLLCLAYAGLAQGLFAGKHLWLPLSFPLLVQAPVAIAWASYLRAYRVRAQRARLNEVFRHFLPKRVIDELLSRQGEIGNLSEIRFGACVMSDVEGYTRIAERLHPQALGELMRTYFDALYPVIRASRGEVTDLQGDSVLAIWTGEATEVELRRRACLAALELQSVIADFNAQRPDEQLPALTGITCGTLSLGLVGSAGHYHYGPTGDVVNTSERLQRLNKLMGTRVLAAAAVVEGLDDLLVRDVGSFLVRNKATPVRVFELMGTKAAAPDRSTALCQRFVQALDLARRANVIDAVVLLEALHQEYPEDGPVAFYLHHLKACPNWDGSPLRQD